MDESTMLPPAKNSKLDDIGDTNCSDWLSGLPDDVLICILSLLPLKAAVGMSVMSRRWKHLWAFVPNIQICEWSFSERSLFLDFVERLFILRGESSMVAFSLLCRVGADLSFITKWTYAALRCNVQNLSLTLQHYESPYTMPFSLRSETLTKFKLEISCILILPPSVSLPNLKVLTISYVIFVDDESVQKLFFCPLLESLSIKQCQWRNLKTIHISAPNLQFLDVNEDFGDEDDYDEDAFSFEDAMSYDRRVHIHSASLKSFLYRGALINEYCILGDTTQLVEKVQIIVSREDVDADMDIVAPREYKLLTDVANVKELILSHDFLMDLSEQDELLDTLPLFCNISKLILEGEIYPSSIRVLSMLLWRSPCLRHLEFSEGFGCLPDNARDESLDPELLDPVPSCFQTELKRISLSLGKDFGDHDYNLFSSISDYVESNRLLLGLVLKAATVLEEVKVYYRKEYLRLEYLENRFTTLPLGSKNCQISFVGFSPEYS